MAEPTIYKDIGSDLFREVVGFDFGSNTDAIWVRFSTTTDMCCLLEQALPPLNLRELFLLAEVLPNTINPTISEFQGAFGRLKLLGFNKNRSLRKKFSGSSASFFLDAAPISFGKEWGAYLIAVYNSAAGILLGESYALNPDLESALRQNCFSKLILNLIDLYKVVGVFVEDNLGTRSVVFLGESLASDISFPTTTIYETRASLSESICAYGDRLVNQRIFEHALSLS